MRRVAGFFTFNKPLLPNDLPTWRRSCYTEGLEDRAGAHAGVLVLAWCVAQCELVLPGRARRESLGAEDGARVALVDL